MLTSKLEGCIYKDCPLCGVSTDIQTTILGLRGRIDEAYEIISKRNELIHELQQKLAAKEAKP